MATGALSRATGLPVTQYPRESSYNQQTTQQTAGKETTGTTTAQDRVNQSVSSVLSAVNTTPEALNALNVLLAQLTGTPAKPAVSAAEAKTQLPDVVPISTGERSRYTVGGWVPATAATWRDPLTGKTMSQQEAQRVNRERAQQRKQLVATGATEAVPGGTPEQQQQQADRQQEIVRNRAAQETYSKEAAVGDAQALVNKSIADALEAAAPLITRYSEGAGASRNTTAALLTEKAALKGATEGAALGAQLGVSYGGIQNQLASTLELLTRSDPNSPTALLLQAIIGSKGLVQDSAQSQSTSGTTTKTAETVQQQGPETTYQDTMKQILNPIQPLLDNINTAPTTVAQPSQGSYMLVKRTGDGGPADASTGAVVAAPTMDELFSDGVS